MRISTYLVKLDDVHEGYGTSEKLCNWLDVGDRRATVHIAECERFEFAIGDGDGAAMDGGRSLRTSGGSRRRRETVDPIPDILARSGCCMMMGEYLRGWWIGEGGVETVDEATCFDVKVVIWFCSK